MHGNADVELALRANLAERLGEARFGLWFGEGVELGIDGDALKVSVPNGFFREWIQGHFGDTLVSAGEAVTGRPLRLSFRVEAEPRVGSVVSPPVPGDGRRRQPRPVIVPPVPPRPSHPAETPRGFCRRARRLEDFATGPGNRLAHAVAVEMAQSAGAAFNPLVIHGGVGLGKTHLLEGIAVAMRARHPGLSVLQLTAEGFTNSFLEAMRAGALNAFRARHRGAGALIMDDVHFLAAKRATQDEFLHTFNALVAAGAPVVLAADQHPRLISSLGDELITRFLGGMVVKLEGPDADTRRAILKSKAALRGVEVPDAVIDYLAELLRSSVRELEGALHSLIGHAQLTGKRLDLALAKTALRDTIHHTNQAVALRDIERAVCQLFQVEPETLKSEGRGRSIVYPRMLAMYLARKHTAAAYSEIGRYFGGRNHSTVISAGKKVTHWLRDEKHTAPLAGFETVADILSALEKAIGV